MNRLLPILALATAVIVASGVPLDAQNFPTSGWSTDFSRHSVPFEEIVSGGVPKDGIPALTNPSFVTIREADRWIDDREPVALIRVGEFVKIYPLQILIWHEIVNDQIGDLPVSVTFCPLCNTTIAFDRRHEGRTLEFGVTGNLRHSDMVMYDRQTETWWQQATGEGIVGELTGTTLTQVPAPVVSWAQARVDAPDGVVLSRETGYDREYGRNPYRGYDTQDGPYPGFFSKRPDPRLDVMERVVAMGGEDDPVAVPFSALRERRFIELEVNGEDVVVFWSPGTRSALDNRNMDKSRDVGSGVAFRPEAGGRSLTFELHQGGIRDRETGTSWDSMGRAATGPLVGERLEPIEHANHFWFAWAVFRPDTRIVRQ
ncbi:MAG: DUF3179 domain-containing protein [Longimicrobiales bacterium]|nr:DUF3179 domain-containing protein [Longimicrobiales bacterium]